ncbi:MAG TPA: hypothetical protein VGE52_18015 [Pirellulales bacterium]
MFLRSTALLRGVLLLGLIATAGCGSSNLVAVTGKITLNGQPISKGTIAFQPTGQGPVAAGSIANGEFRLSTGDGVGVAPGDYTVTVVAYGDTSPAAPGQPMPVPKVVSPAKYANVGTSDLKVKITSSGMEPAELALTGQPDAPAAATPPKK